MGRSMSFWWKWTVEYPARLGDWLYLILAVKPAEILDRLTARRAFLAIMLLITVIAFAQTLPADMALLLAGDVTAYVDILAIGLLFTARGRAKDTLLFLKRKTADALRAFATGIGHARVWMVRQGKTGIVRRSFAGRKKASGDEPAAGFAFA